MQEKGECYLRPVFSYCLSYSSAILFNHRAFPISLCDFSCFSVVTVPNSNASTFVPHPGNAGGSVRELLVRNTVTCVSKCAIA